MKIKAITFDLWQTLVYEIAEQELQRQQLRNESVTRILADNGFKIKSDRFDKAHAETWSRCEAIWAKDKDISIKDQTIIYLQCLDSGIDWLGIASFLLEELIAAYTEPIIQLPPCLYEDTQEVLDYLHGQNLKIGLICNTGRTPGISLRKVLKGFQITQYFDILTFSNELLIRKPAREIFLHTLTGLGVKPSESMHVGDNPIADITGAKKIGMRAVWLKRQDLREAKIKPDFIVNNLKELVDIVWA